MSTHSRSKKKKKKKSPKILSEISADTSPEPPFEIIAKILAIAGILMPSQFGKDVYFYFSVELPTAFLYLSEKKKMELFLKACKANKEKHGLKLFDCLGLGVVDWEGCDQKPKISPKMYTLSRALLICAKKGHTTLLKTLLAQSNFRPVRLVDGSGTIRTETKYINLLHNLYLNAILKKRYEIVRFLQKFCDISDADYIKYTIRSRKGFGKMRKYLGV